MKELLERWDQIAATVKADKEADHDVDHDVLASDETGSIICVYVKSKTKA